MRFVFFNIYRLVVLIVSLSIVGTLSSADWTTYRGNNERTGNVDGKGGPYDPSVLWVHKSKDDFIAAPVPTRNALLVSALGAFNTSSFQAFALDVAPQQRVLWTKAVPYLKLPTVSSPSYSDQLLVFGDGMHQTDGAVLHGIRTDSGMPLWQLPLPGHLVHLEGSPTIAQGRVFIGGGNAGVLCVDPSHLQLDGKNVDAAVAQTMLEKRWQELVAKFEKEKKVDPDFAIPPNEDSLPKPRPKIVWQVGVGQMHVDAPLAVVGDRVLVASAFLDEEKVGYRGLLCLSATDGSVIWKTPLKFNPWGGPTVVDDTILLGGSNIRLEPKDVAKGKGEVLAISLKDGAVIWRKDVAGGVVSSIASRFGFAIFTSTDGHVRGWDVGSGKEVWDYKSNSPFFAGPALAAGSVFVGDLRGVVHAINGADGKKMWSLDLSKEPKIAAPGMIYGSPVIDGGRLYVATCNLTKQGAATSSVVVCIGEKE